MALRWAIGVRLVVVAALLGGCARIEAPAPSAAPHTPDEATIPHLVTIPPDSPQTKRMRVEPVRAANIPADEVVAPGKIIINPNRTSKLLLPVAGRIVDVMARLGDSVSQGQPLIAVESPDADAAVAVHQQTVAIEHQAQAMLTRARIEFDRAKDLYDVKAVAEKDFVAAQNDFAQAKAGLETARAGVEQARRKLELLGLNRTLSTSGRSRGRRSPARSSRSTSRPVSTGTTHLLRS